MAPNESTGTQKVGQLKKNTEFCFHNNKLDSSLKLSSSGLVIVKQKHNENTHSFPIGRKELIFLKSILSDYKSQKDFNLCSSTYIMGDK